MVTLKAAPPTGGEGGSGGYRNGLEVLRERLDNVIRSQQRAEAQLELIEREIRSNFVTRQEFERLADAAVLKEGRYWLVEKLVFGMVAMILAGTVGALIAQVIR